jgi:o-succinylbenzoate synthase
VTRVHSVELFHVGIPLVRPFRTSFGESADKRCLLARVQTDVGHGWGECVADEDPGFSGEFTGGVRLAIRDFLAPLLFAAGDVEPEQLDGVLAPIRGNQMAKATIANAVLDAELRARGTSLASSLGADRERVECGVSVGIQATTEALLDQVGSFIGDGYRRIKLKVAPGLDVDRVRAVRERHPDISLSVDANAAYTLDDAAVFDALDELGLLMIEQPLHHEDLLDHAELQARLATPICLDESIRSAADARAALRLGACRIINIKQGRVGGIHEARRVHDVCRAEGVPVWCGGMLETGIGRATNLALAAMPGFTLPGDTSPSSRYFHEDLTAAFEMDPDGTMAVPRGPGIGVDPIPARLEAATLGQEVLRP